MSDRLDNFGLPLLYNRLYVVSDESIYVCIFFLPMHSVSLFTVHLPPLHLLRLRQEKKNK